MKQIKDSTFMSINTTLIDNQEENNICSSKISNQD